MAVRHPSHDERQENDPKGEQQDRHCRSIQFGLHLYFNPVHPDDPHSSSLEILTETFSFLSIEIRGPLNIQFFTAKTPSPPRKPFVFIRKAKRHEYQKS
jgi:hypothetical protein